MVEIFFYSVFLPFCWFDFRVFFFLFLLSAEHWINHRFDSVEQDETRQTARMAELKVHKHPGSTEAFEMSRETLAPATKTTSWPFLPDDDNRTLVDLQRYESYNKEYDDTEPVLRKRRNPDDDYEYPSSWKLVLITTGLCFCVFCMALVLLRGTLLKIMNRC